MSLKKVINNPFFHCALIIALFAYAYGRVLGSYFLADDFGEILYVSEIFRGDTGKLISNFTGNYMQIPSMAVYRPWLLMSLIIDYAIWGTNAWGYYLTNSLHYLACSILIYLIIRKLTGYWGDLRSGLAAFFSAAIFTVCPLHCESLSWVVGRVDIVCLSFYLAGLLAVIQFVYTRKKACLLGSLLAFVLAITTKEMAIGLPVVASVLAFLYSKQPGVLPSTQDPDKKQDFITDAKERLALCAPVLTAYGIATVVYFTIRYLALGTFTGGYTGSIGATQISNLITRWTDLDSYRRILFPFNYDLMEDGGPYRLILAAAYLFVIILVGARFLSGKFPRRLLLLILIFLATCLAPIYQLFGLGYNLEGMRFLFFTSAPLAMLIPALIFAPNKTTLEKTSSAHSSTRELTLAVVAMLLILFVFVKTSYKNNTVWIEAGRQTRAVTEKLREKAKSLRAGEKLAVLGIPKDRSGAHMILNGPTLLFSLAPPFSSTNLSDRVLTFDPMLFGREDLINRNHFKETLRESKVKQYLLWDFDSRDFKPLKLEFKKADQQQEIHIPELVTVDGRPKEPILLPHSKGRGYITPITLKNNAIEFNRAGNGLGLEIAPLNITPSQYDYLELLINISDQSELQNKPVHLSWMGNNVLSPERSQAHSIHLPVNLETEGNDQKLVLPLSTFWEWYSFKYINNIFLKLPTVTSLSILKARLLPARTVEPEITIRNVKPTNYGSFLLGKEKNIAVQVTPLPGTSKVELEVSKLNFFFENFQGKSEELAIQKTLTSNESAPSFNISRDLFKASETGYSQIRARCIKEDGKKLGVYSAPLTLEIID